MSASRSVGISERATYEDVRAAPRDQVAELIEGTLYVHPRPAIPHAHAASVLGMDLGSAFHRGRGGPGGWVILFEPELHFGADVVVPDLAGWRRERMPEAPETPWIELEPDWLCEVLPPSNVRTDGQLELAVYARVGVRHVWLLDPTARTLEAFRLESGRWVVAALLGEEPKVRAEPFEAIELDLGALWTSGRVRRGRSDRRRRVGVARRHATCGTLCERCRA